MLNAAILKHCSRCGEGFACGPQSGKCWCEELPAIAPSAEIGDCLCPLCLKAEIESRKSAGGEKRPLVEGEDYTREGPAIVFTARYHLRRGYCCGNGCRHCPYGEMHGQKRGPT